MSVREGGLDMQNCTAIAHKLSTACVYTSEPEPMQCKLLNNTQLGRPHNAEFRVEETSKERNVQ